MANSKKYPIANSIKQMALVLQLDPARVLRRAGLSQDFLGNEGRGATTSEYFALWDAVYQEVGNPEFLLETAKTLAGSPFIPAMLAFSASPNTEIGLTRLALFKPLVGPIKLDVTRVGQTVELAIASSDDDIPMPASAATFETVYFIESMRKFTGHRVVPVSIGLPDAAADAAPLAAYFGVTPHQSSIACIALNLEDAHRPLISENAEFWQWLEVDLKRQLAEREANATVAERVRAVLIDLLPSGDASADTVAKRLGMSKRSLQRRLTEEGDPFQTVLDATRSELAMRYLSKGETSVEEISFLLAYRDPNSFYRAFHGWTGMTPAEARGRPLQ